MTTYAVIGEAHGSFFNENGFQARENAEEYASLVIDGDVDSTVEVLDQDSASYQVLVAIQAAKEARKQRRAAIMAARLAAGEIVEAYGKSLPSVITRKVVTRAQRIVDASNELLELL